MKLLQTIVEVTLFGGAICSIIAYTVYNMARLVN